MAIYTLVPTQHNLKTTNQKCSIFYRLTLKLKHPYIDAEKKNLKVKKKILCVLKCKNYK